MKTIRVKLENDIFCLQGSANGLTVEKLLGLMQFIPNELPTRFILYYVDKEQDRVNIAVDEDLKEMYIQMESPVVNIEVCLNGGFTLKKEPVITSEHVDGLVREHMLNQQDAMLNTHSVIQQLQLIIASQRQELIDTKEALEQQVKINMDLNLRIPKPAKERKPLELTEINPNNSRIQVLRDINEYCLEKTKMPKLLDAIHPWISSLVTSSTCIYGAETPAEHSHAQEFFGQTVQKLLQQLETYAQEASKNRTKRLELRNEVKQLVMQKSPQSSKKRYSILKCQEVVAVQTVPRKGKKNVGFSEVVVEIDGDSNDDRIQILMEVTGLQQEEIKVAIDQFPALTDEELIHLLLGTQ